MRERGREGEVIGWGFDPNQLLAPYRRWGFRPIRLDKVIAIDLSSNMIEVALKNSKQYSNIEFQVADILQWDFPTEEFDVIVSIATVREHPKCAKT